ncbi:MAG: M3 family metallopeptidase [Bacteroidales bacterium]|nr:M3 family metallopeptidase [Bacteroidales bacterium]
MNKTLTLLAAGAMALSASTAMTMNAQSSTAVSGNPLLAPYTTQYQIPPFESITPAMILEAVEKGIDEQKAEIRAICVNRAVPDFDNTVLAMEKSGETLNRVMALFFAYDDALSSPELEEVAAKVYPMYSDASDEIMMNPALFDKVKYVYDNRDRQGLDPQQKLAVEKLYKSFTRNGALLSDEQKEELKKINVALADLYLKYNKNLLSATNQFELVVTDADMLAGLPGSLVATAADEAKERGKEGSWVFTLHAPSRLPVLQYADNRDLRRRMYEGYTSLATTAPYDNRPVINEIVKLRARKAHLLGFKNYADYMTDNVMAKTTEAAENLLMQIYRPAVDRVQEEVAEMRAVIDAEGGNFTLAPWDYYYYAEKVRRNKFALDENEVRAYFSLENVRKGIFTLAERLYGVKFKELPDAPKYHPEVNVYEVTDLDGNHVAVFMTDYFPRASKRQGAWMSEFQGSYVDPDGSVQRPIIFNVGNFTRPAGDTPALLTLDEVETMFHEFGHGLHGMLSRAKLRSQSGTNVDRDFVELPSQITEHWALEPELLKDYAFHYKTGEVIPDSLIRKLEAASTHNQGFMTTELAGAALLDLQWGKLNPTGDTDVEAFEAQVAKDLGMPEQIAFRYRSPYFKHIFGSDGYASGYYTYLWAAVLDTDGFELFKEKGVFDPATAESFKKNILEMGGSADPMELYVKFRGHEPKVDALLRSRGLKPAPSIGDVTTPGGK